VSASRPSVLVVHGLWMNGLETHWLRQRLETRGFAPRAFSYRSLHADLPEVVAALEAQVRALPPPVHLVGHSLGGVMLLALFDRVSDLPEGRVVLLGSPVNGSCAATAVSRWPIGPAVLGRLALQELVGTRRRSWTQPRDLGVIAGSTSAGMGRFVSDLPEPNDGTVAVEETLISGMKEHLVLPVTHTGMLLSECVARQVCRFIMTGAFEP
jgi:pimeloyl-ACP methyl ester carboxylesterase